VHPAGLIASAGIAAPARVAIMHKLATTILPHFTSFILISSFLLLFLECGCDTEPLNTNLKGYYR